MHKSSSWVVEYEIVVGENINFVTKWIRISKFRDMSFVQRTMFHITQKPFGKIHYHEGVMIRGIFQCKFNHVERERLGQFRFGCARLVELNEPHQVRRINATYVFQVKWYFSTSSPFIAYFLVQQHKSFSRKPPELASCVFPLSAI